MSELANNIKALRAERQMTQQELARAVGVTRKTINTVENQVYVPSTVLALKIASVLGVSVEDVFELAEPLVVRPLPAH